MQMGDTTHREAPTAAPAWIHLECPTPEHRIHLEGPTADHRQITTVLRK
jgi:hypothetical protein